MGKARKTGNMEKPYKSGKPEKPGKRINTTSLDKRCETMRNTISFKEAGIRIE